VTGRIVAVVYVGITSLLGEVIGLGFETSLAIGFILAIATHFTLQRLFVRRHPASYALPVHHQLVRYLVVAGIQYGLTAIVVATMPRALGTGSGVSADRAGDLSGEFLGLPLSYLPSHGRALDLVPAARPPID
jgi:putative flippase GtrA